MKCCGGDVTNEINPTETLAVVLANKTEFKVRRIPDFPCPSFFVFSGSTALFFVTVQDKLKLHAVIERGKSPKPFIVSTSFNKKQVTFSLDGQQLGKCLSNGSLAWELSNAKGDKLYDIAADKETLRTTVTSVKQEQVAVVQWNLDRRWMDNDPNRFVSGEIPPRNTFTIKLTNELRSPEKSLLLVSLFVVHCCQANHKRRCWDSTTCVISGLFFVLFCIALIPVVVLLTKT